MRADLDSIIESGDAFIFRKHDRTTTVGILKGKDFGLDQDVTVKRFNCRGFFDRIVSWLFFSRARRIWKINLRLYENGLPVARPVCYINSSFRTRNSFFISTVIEDADNLGYMFKRGLCREPEKVVSLLGRAVAAWHMAGAVHGDLKWSNMMLQGNDKIFFIDLDQARLYSTPKVKGIIKDLVRFCRYGMELEKEDLVRSIFFPVYLSLLPERLKKEIDSAEIEAEARKQWKRKGQRRL